MDWLRHLPIRVGCALFAFFLVSGDMIADSIHDAKGECVAESQNSTHDSCPACGRTIHTGSAMMADSLIIVLPAATRVERVTIADDASVIGVPAAIDHPPQLV